ncbi:MULTISPECIES: SMP-30/gluconolactonase/LRE family protein [unclassified Rathayibacter]|uniref:SMP-30/gluconolactonase/LRE family protein n=1 Tax=unclassified Rathayibacter TaxID=2609250 RepID=UPI001FB1E8B3|nr:MULTISPECIES: SMP-30/gluconolactonase/LRE family protein [unclassified Rathayibacter]MCJ1674634.1 SMP-30/gluconolactonase/LRE family protein [Rathayibacter sp. VKM Ac-2929]MCJ1682743.1 SMP-30/gluconolactonase/LRE family protein [Rathayibacter sp. VKM Ac-2928]
MRSAPPPGDRGRRALRRARPRSEAQDSYDVADRGAGARDGRLFAEIEHGLPDGIAVDERGRVWSSAGDGVHVFAPDGAELLFVPVPEVVANVCFGGPDGTDLFIAATTSLYRLRTRTRAARATTA